jgi:hypothetical protein
MSASDRLAELLGLTAEEIDESILVGETVIASSAATATPDAASVHSNEDSTLLSESSDKVGLANCGNTCYMNAVLQMLYHIPEFKEGVTTFGDVIESLDEPYPTLYRIFTGMDSAAQEGKTTYNPGELLNPIFECLYNIPEGRTYRANQYNPLPLNRTFREEGIKKGYFTEDNIKLYKEGNLGDYFKRRELFNKLLARNQAAVKAGTPAEIAKLKKDLDKAKKSAAVNLEEILDTKFTSRRQEDASQFLDSCIFSKVEDVTKTFCRHHLINKLTGIYNPIDFPADTLSTTVRFKDEDNVDTILYDGGVENGFRKKFKVVPASPNYIFFGDLAEGIQSVEDILNISIKERIPTFDRRGGRDSITLNIPKNVGQKLDKSKRFNTTHRIIPQYIEKELFTQILPDQNYFIISLKRYNNDLTKNTTKIKMNKEISFTSNIVQADGTVTPSIVNFELEGVICHMGPSIAGGHYYYYWKDPTGIWFNFNDSNVSKLPVIPDSKYLRINDIEKEGYILLYKRMERELTPIPADYRNYDSEEPISTTFPSFKEIEAQLEADLNLSTLNFKTDDNLKSEYGFSNAKIKELRNKASIKYSTTPSFKGLDYGTNLNAAIAESLRIAEEEQKKSVPIPSVKELTEQLAQLQGTKSEVFMNEPISGNLGMQESIKQFVDDSIKRYINNVGEAENILKFDDDILFEIAKQLSPSKSYPKIISPLRSSIIKRLRESDKEKGTTYIYQLTQTWQSKVYFIPPSKFMPKPLSNYNEAAYQANKTRYEKKKGGTRSGRKSLRRKTRKLTKPKV